MKATAFVGWVAALACVAATPAGPGAGAGAGGQALALGVEGGHLVAGADEPGRHGPPPICPSPRKPMLIMVRSFAPPPVRNPTARPVPGQGAGGPGYFAGLRRS